MSNDFVQRLIYVSAGFTISKDIYLALSDVEVKADIFVMRPLVDLR